MLLFERVSKWYGPVIGVNQVTLELRPGITGLVGANGAGKSTLLRLATGQLRPDLGRVLVRGLDAWSATAKRHVGYCPDIDSFYEEMSGRQFVEAMARLCGYSRREAQERTDEVLDLVGMTDRAERRLRGYSKGMRQRIKLAQALVHDPELLVLDEPLSGIDPVGRWESINLFRELADRGKCLLISSHELEELEKLTDHVAIMARGRIAAVGTLAQIRDLLDDHPLTIRVDLDCGLRIADCGLNRDADCRLKRDGEPADGQTAGRAEGEDSSENPQPAIRNPQSKDRRRELAAALLRLPDVVGVDLGEGGSLLVCARNPRQFFRDFARLVVEEFYEIRHLETLDDSAEAILGYLLGGRRVAR
ncbi:MAG TPA: ABC transporter ATP-binding protein [Gemmataceae bacterium]|nr:ABC transporter ATP-binding protein [Gemmataceae bacterium]